jgi:hypothetical protein
VIYTIAPSPLLAPVIWIARTTATSISPKTTARQWTNVTPAGSHVVEQSGDDGSVALRCEHRIRSLTSDTN